MWSLNLFPTLVYFLGPMFVINKKFCLIWKVIKTKLFEETFRKRKEKI